MRFLCLACPELGERRELARKHFEERSVPVEFLPAIHGEAFGILGTHPYRDDAPGAGFVIGYAQTGLFLSHYMAWVAISICDKELTMILEDDAEFPVDWNKRLDVAVGEWLKGDEDVLLVGSSNTADKPKRHVRGPLWEIKYPFCTHAYIVRSKAIPVLLEKMRDCYTNIDIALAQRAYPHLKVLTVLPRIVDQRNMTLAE